MSNRLLAARVNLRQACSNPVPGPERYLWVAQGRDLVGHRDGHQPIVLLRTKLAPLPKFTPDPGIVKRTLSNGLGTVTLEPKQLRPRERKQKGIAPGGWGTQAPASLNMRPRATRDFTSHTRPDGKVLTQPIYVQSVVVPRAPTWRQEVAGWSRENWSGLGSCSRWSDE